MRAQALTASLACACDQSSCVMPKHVPEAQPARALHSMSGTVHHSLDGHLLFGEAERALRQRIVQVGRRQLHVAGQQRGPPQLRSDDAPASAADAVCRLLRPQLDTSSAHIACADAYE